MHKLVIENLKSGYGHKIIVKEVGFVCYPGQLTFLIGPNGCGKTTLLKSVAQLLNYQGSVTIDHHKLKKWTKMEIAQNIAFFAQMTSIQLQFTLFEVVLMGRFPYRQSRLSNYSEKDHEIAFAALARVGMEKFANMPLTNCSGGQLQRTLIARMIAQDPKIIIIDEITNHLDFKYQIEILDFIRKWAIAENKIVLGVLHDLNLVREYADQVLLMKEGHILFKGETQNVLTKQNLKTIYDTDVMQWYQKVSEKWRIN